MSDFEFKPVNPFVKKNPRPAERPPTKPRQVLTFKAPFQQPEAPLQPQPDRIRTRDVMNGRVGLRPEATDIPELDLEVEEVLQPQTHAQTAGGRKKPFGRASRPEGGAPALPQLGQELLGNPMAQLGLEYSKR